MNTKEVLQEARRILPGHWTQGTNFRDAGGMALPSHLADLAVCYCLNGAVMKASDYLDGPSSGYLKALDALKYTTEEVNRLGIAIWNDTNGRTEAEVLELLDKAIARL